MRIHNRFCRPHTTGVPSNLAGKRWYNPGCETCDAKLAAGTVAVTDPRSDTIKRREHFGRVAHLLRPGR